ncbi:glycosyltransferase family 4 protein [Desulfocucumis palustris]|nr:glycosyltransferase [Desulfocucumis palustris]
MSGRILFIPPEYDCNISNAQILKDTCLVPCLLQKYYGYHTTIAAYSIDESLLKIHFPDCKFECINYTGIFNRDAHTYINEHANNFDILFMFGPYECYVEFGAIYKKCNPDGKIYLKLDMNRYWLSRIISTQHFSALLGMCHLISVESYNLYRIINRETPFNVELIPNGFYETFPVEPLGYPEKENIIITVGRLGIVEKQTDVLLKAFLDADIPGWKLKLIGNVAQRFLSTMETFREHPKFEQAVEFTGPIYDRQKLEEEYRRAKIFCMTSNVEAYAHVFAEAAKNGCYIISTDVDGAYDITDNEQYGTVVPVGDCKTITGAFEKICPDDDKIQEVFNGMYSFARSELSWKYILGKLDILFHLKGLAK